MVPYSAQTNNIKNNEMTLYHFFIYNAIYVSRTYGKSDSPVARRGWVL